MPSLITSIHIWSPVSKAWPTSTFVIPASGLVDHCLPSALMRIVSMAITSSAPSSTSKLTFSSPSPQTTHSVAEAGPASAADRTAAVRRGFMA